MLLVVFQGPYVHLEFEAAVKFGPAVCPGCTPLAGRELFTPCSKSDPEVAFLCPSSLAPPEEKPYPPHQCSDVHFRTQRTDACQFCTKINPSGALNFSCKHIHSTDPYHLLPCTLTHTKLMKCCVTVSYVPLQLTFSIFIPTTKVLYFVYKNSFISIFLNHSKTQFSWKWSCKMLVAAE